MCTRYSLTSPPEAVRRYFGYASGHDFPPRYNIAPTQPVPIVRLDHAERRELALVRWGLIPSWVKDPARLSLLLNARAETADDKPSFRGGMRHRRCLVPADAYYAWSGPAKQRRPHMIRLKAGGPMALAGIWETWLGTDGSEIDTMAILTVPANPQLRAIEERMPAILAPDELGTWLDTRTVRAEEALRLLRPAAEGLLEAHEVSAKLNDSRREGPEVQEIISPRII